jgi:ATP-binding cassette subfamily B protein
MWSADPALTIAFGLCSLCVASLTAAFVLASGNAIGGLPAALRDGPGSPALHRVELAAFAMAGVFIVQQLFAGIQDQLASTIGRRVEGALRIRVAKALAEPPTLGHTEDPDVQRMLASATTVGTARYGVTAALGFGVSSINGVLVALWMALLLASFRWWLAAGLTVFWLIVRSYVHREALAYWAVLGFQTAGSQRSVYFRDLGLTPPAAKEVRIFGLGEWIVDRFSEHWAQSHEDEAARKTRSHVSLLLVVPIVALHVLAFLLAVNALRGAAIDLRQFAVATQAILGLAVLGVSWRDQVVVNWGGATVPPVWDLEELMTSLPSPPRGLPADAMPRRAIELRDVSFSYPGNPKLVLDGLRLDIPSGTSLALVGSNGAGKTTIVKLLCRLTEPISGSILVDGAPVHTLDAVGWRRRIAVLFQDFVHYPLSAADNVTFGAIEAPADRARLDRIADRAGLAELVSALPGGWDTPLSRQFRGGADLSGGEWQRVALARTLWAIEAGATVLILDEPTANLDVRAEARFYEQFLSLTQGRTTILVSHRFASVRQADLICVIDGGHVAEQGTHSSLMAMDGLYARMFDAQSVALESVGNE